MSVGWGIIGCGWVVRDYVAPALRDAENASVVACVDPSYDAREAVGRIFPQARTLAGIQELFEVPGLDAVYVATPNHLHREAVLAAAEAGKHVLCEKPISPTLAEAKEMVRACQRAGVVYATAFDQRFHAAHLHLRGLVGEGSLGTVCSVRIRYACWLPPEWSPDGISTDNWRADPERAGGGAFTDLAPHGVDLAQYLLGEDLVETKAILQRRVFDYSVEDGASLIGRFTSGALLSQQVAYNTREVFPRRELEVVGTEAMAVATDTMGQTPGGTLEIVHSPDGNRESVEVPDGWRSPFLNQIEAFGDALISGKPFPHPPERDLHTMELLELQTTRDDPSKKAARPKVADMRNKDTKRAGAPGASKETPHGSRIPEDWPSDAGLPSYICTNCGFWQKYFRRPERCPVCEDARHVLPEGGYEFLTAAEMGERVRCVREEVEPGVWKFSVEPAVGISPSGYLIVSDDGNVAFEGCPFYDEEALGHMESLGGVEFVSASHPHTYGAVWQIVERFGPEVSIHREDLGWASAFGVTLPFDSALDLPGGLRLLHTGGHFDGHAVMHDPGRGILFVGDAVKLELADSDPTGRTSDGISAHKAFVRRVPLTRAELGKYREVFEGLEFSKTFTPFEQCTNVGPQEVLGLIDAQLDGLPFVGVLGL